MRQHHALRIARRPGSVHDGRQIVSAQSRLTTLEFLSTAVRPLGGNRFQLVGDLTIRDMTREVTLEAEYVGVHDSPFGTKVATFSAGAEFDREDFGMTWNVVIETGGLLVSKKVEIELEIEAVYQA